MNRNTLICIILCWLVFACSPGHHLSEKHSDQRDSTVINYKDSVRIKDSLRIRDTLVAVPLPVEASQNILLSFMPSHLETSLAESDAWVDSIGLHHTIANKKGSVNAAVQVTDHFQTIEHTTQKDSTNVSESHESETITVEVEREFTWWEKFRLRAFWWLSGLLVLALLWIFRKPIIALIKKLI